MRFRSQYRSDFDKIDSKLEGAMSNIIATGEPPEAVRLIIKVYASLLLAGFAFIPAYLIGYLFFFQDPTLLFENHAFHIIAITAATLEGLFVTYVTWRCYQSSGEPLLRWMTLGFLGFVLIYALHGAFTGLAHHNIWLFLLYGPASRLVMAILLLVGILSYHRPPDAADQRTNPRPWLIWIGLFLLVDLAVAYIANSSIASNLAVRLSLEGGALVFSTLNVAILLLRRIRSQLMVIFVISVTAFALSSLAFILARPWNHMWWLAHAIFAAGFFLLSYGVVQAFLTTRSFSTIYSQEELMVRLAEAMEYTYQEYVLTEKGKGLFPLIIGLRQWGEAFFYEAGEAHSRVVDREQGRPVRPLELRAEDGRLLGPEDCVRLAAQ